MPDTVTPEQLDAFLEVLDRCEVPDCGSCRDLIIEKAPALVRTIREQRARLDAAEKVCEQAQLLVSCPCSNRPYQDYDGPQWDCPKHGYYAGIVAGRALSEEAGQ